MLLNQRHSYLLKKPFSFLQSCRSLRAGTNMLPAEDSVSWSGPGQAGGTCGHHLWHRREQRQRGAVELPPKLTRVLGDTQEMVTQVERYLNLHFWSVLIYISTLNTSTTLKPLVLLASCTSFLSPVTSILCLHIAHFAHNYFQPHTYCKVKCSISFFYGRTFLSVQFCESQFSTFQVLGHSPFVSGQLH